MESLTGKLLIASPAMGDPNFARSVTLLFEHGADTGALGLILDRPSTLRVADHLEDWGEHVVEPKVVFIGGPVQPEVAIGVAWCPGAPAADDWVPVAGGHGLVDLSREPQEIPGLVAARVFSGYSGWGPGQLEMELAIGSWIVADPSPEDVLTSDPEGLWRTVLKRQPGLMKAFADFPLDPSLN